MTNVELDQIETTFGIRLPSGYRTLMASGVFTMDEIDNYILNDVGSVIGINKELRTGEFSREWKPQWFIIGNDDCGNIYFIDVIEESSIVYLWDHETHQVEHFANSLDAFLVQLQQIL